ncbi:GNAT family N-acetyltransferase [Myroides sp. M-43]|uniref:GNAT family N-acetyltransferase n=1 Tax=Myroides oncorhynchi TaxID=2893756 RepID=UPI001E6555FA|nr:GNAT family N-acetyltransferase [Myroides oncorhynchi]MCC9044428.1 GNAT family N-acetyltransferase [Myroides oncorhynchi]
MFLEEIYPQYKIERIDDSQLLPYPLLLLADETVHAIDKYVFDSDVYVLKEGGNDLAVFCLYQIDIDTVELKNIAVSSDFQGRGVGSLLIKRIVQLASAEGYHQIIVGTADCGVDQIRFYERNGFKKYGIKKDFFIENYEEPIIENGIQLRDMIMLKINI